MAEPTPENAATDASVADAATVQAAAETQEAAGTAEVAGADAAAQKVASVGTDVALGASLPPAAADIDLSHLPVHTRSLLKIEVTVRVTLAHQRRPIQEITELGPGTLVKFEKTYDEPLELSVGDLPIAQGDVVKVGDKFGLRIGKIIRPHERFASVRS